MQRFRAIIEEARTAFAGDLQKEKLQKHVIPKGHPEFFHNLVFRCEFRDLILIKLNKICCFSFSNGLQFIAYV